MARTALIVFFLSTAAFALAMRERLDAPANIDCHNQLSEWLNEEGRTRRLCFRVPSEINEILGNCKPSDPVYTVAVLQNIFKRLSDGSLPCIGSSTAPARVPSFYNCAAAMQCMQSVLYDNAPGSFDCSTDQRSSYGVQMGINCLSQARSSCASSEIMEYILTQADKSICLHKTACVNENGFSQTTEGSNCTKWQWMGSSDAMRLEFPIGDDAMFDTDSCNVVRAGEGACYN